MTNPMTMVEKVTAVLSEKFDLDCNSGCSSERCVCSGLIDSFECKLGIDFDDFICTAITAMREPSEEMLAGYLPFKQDGSALSVYRALIDAALAEGK